MLYRSNYNDFLASLVKKSTGPDKILRDKQSLIQVVDPVFLIPQDQKNGSLRTHFYSPIKYLFGHQMETLWFNLLIIWALSILLYFALYFDLLSRFIVMINDVKKKN